MSLASWSPADCHYFEEYLKTKVAVIDTEEAQALVQNYFTKVFKPPYLYAWDFRKRQEIIRDLIDQGARRYLKDPVDFYDYFSNSSISFDKYQGAALPPHEEDDFDWVKAFSTPVPELGIFAMLTPDELERLKDRYEALKACAGKIKAPSKDPIERLAYLRDLAWKILGKYPNSTQMLTLLALIDESFPRGRLAQVKTGEGKSLIVLILAAYFLLEGKKVHIVTSGQDLAKRDELASRAWFESLGYSSGTACDPLSLSAHERSFDEAVLFGVSTDFEFLFLNDKLNPEVPPKLNFTDVVALIDEVDNLWIDSALSSARMDIPDPIDCSWVFPKIMEALQANTPEALEALKVSLSEFPEDKIDAWIRAGQQALIYKKDEDYLVQKGEILIVEKALTGEFKIGCRWGNGVHECLEAKEGLKVQASSLTLASISHPIFFRHYEKLLGLSGSMGSPAEQAELERVYGLSTFHVPPHRPSLFVKHSPFIAPDENTHQLSLLDKLSEQAHRPVILLVLTIAECFRLQTLIKKDKRLSGESRIVQVYNEKQIEDKTFVLDRAGYPGVITITTHIGGRGTDYRLKGDSLKFGFLLLYLFFPDNFRVEVQGFGRVARQGEPGEGQYWLHPGSPGIPKALVSFSSFSFELLCHYREEMNRALSCQRQRALEKSERKFEKFCLFSSHLKEALEANPLHRGLIREELQLSFARS